MEEQSPCPKSGDPSSGDPKSGDPKGGDPKSGDPSSGDPKGGDPSDGGPSEEDLWVQRAQEGDREAYGELVKAHYAGAFRVAAAILGRDEAEDVTQEVFVHVQQKLPSFEGRSRFGTWIYRIATNVSLNRLRSRRRRPQGAPLEEGVVPSAERGPVKRTSDAELRQTFREALAELPEEQRAVVVLRGVEGLSFQEVSEVLQIPVPTAHSRMARAREKLRRSLGEFLPNPAHKERA